MTMCQTIEQASTFTDECDRAGDQLRCQLCPASPSYWRINAAAPAADPWSGIRTRPLADLIPNADFGVVLEWGTGAKPGDKPSVNKPRPCAICGKPSILTTPPSARYPKGRPIHKACGERVLTEQKAARDAQAE
jgi:hypothetical protein